MDITNFFLRSASNFEWKDILIFVAVVAAVLIVLKLLKVGIKWLFRVAVNAVIGCLVLYLVSLIPGVDLVIAWWHVLLTGLFGIPAAVIIIVLKLLNVF